ncbi:hypothetical protein NP284_40060 [Rhodopseudomonas pseudopalustris]|uniref:hypothetical protein n=1 Tax=Rhodopseudomonas pseudopalustris TaxID=1513892 RepID=UPI003F9E2429
MELKTAFDKLSNAPRIEPVVASVESFAFPVTRAMGDAAALLQLSTALGERR